MPKMKSNSGAKKRYALTGTGKIKRKHAYKSHILTKKSTKRKRNLGYSTLVASTDEKNARLLLAGNK
jgi:large subunit ribosomal protein L35